MPGPELAAIFWMNGPTRPIPRSWHFQSHMCAAMPLRISVGIFRRT